MAPDKGTVVGVHANTVDEELSDRSIHSFNNRYLI